MSGLDIVPKPRSAASPTGKELDYTGAGGLSLRPYQREGVRYLLARNRVLLADDMGLGKSPQAIVALREGSAKPALIVCPASLKFVWADEFAKWAPDWRVHVVHNTKHAIDYSADAIIVNYDLLLARHSDLAKYPYKVIVLDEAHYIKNPKSKRTRLAIELAWRCEKRYLLTGTPLLNRPVELTPLLKCLGKLGDFGGWSGFVSRYCPPRKIFRGGTQVVVYDGAANLPELNKRLTMGTMLRRTKKEVLPELPKTQKVIIPLDIDNRPEYDQCEKNLKGWLMQNALLAESPDDVEKWRESVAIMGMASSAETLAKITYLRQVAANGKVAQAIDWIRDFLDGNPGQKLVVFAHHREVLQKLEDAFPEVSVSLKGGDSEGEREHAVKRFQNDPSCRLFFGSLKAANVGITLTAASNVLFVELSWSPADLAQAQDRVNRIGQTADSVTAYYMLGRKTIETHILGLINKKEQIIRDLLDPHT